jgi:PAS domain S-box-containing protein
LPIPGKFPRLAAALAVLLPLLLALDVLFLRPASRSLFVSNSLDFAVVLLAAFCSFYVARRTTAFARQLWTLLGVALTLEALGQALSTYYQTFQPQALGAPVPSDIFFFVWAAPIFMIFLPRSDDDSSPFEWLRILDFLQVAIVALTMYLYFFYSPVRWQGGQFPLIREILLLYIARDLLLCVGFFFRSRASVSPWFRSFSLFLGVVFITAAASDTDFLFTFTSAANTASWGDLIWMIPYLIVIFFAISWKPPASPSAALPASRLGNFFAQQFLPIGLPLLVIFMAQAIAKEQFFLSWLAVIVSVVCSSARLILTNRKTRRVASDLINTEKALRRSEEMLSTAFRSSPDAFSINIFPNGPYIEVNEGFTRLTGYTREDTISKTPREMNLWVDSDERADVLAKITQTGDVRDVEFRFRNKAGQTRFGLMSASLIELDSRTCALVVVRDITARKEAESILRTSEERFRSLVQNLHVGIVIYDPNACIVFANQVVLDLIGLPLNQLAGKTTPELGFSALREDGSVIPEHLRPVVRVLVTRQPVRSLLIGWRLSGRNDVWTLLDAVPEFSSTGEISRVVVSFTNLSEQRRAAEALRESEERFRTLVADLHVAVVLHRPDGRIEFANSAAHRMFNLPDGSAIGKLHADLGFTLYAEDGTPLAPDDYPVASVVRTGAPIPNGLLAIRLAHTDKLNWFFGNAVPQLDANGELIRIIISFADVTEMKNAERSIHQLSTQLLRLQDEERRRIGRELHDGLAQTVLAINLSLAQVRQSLTSEEHPAARALEKARSLTQQMSREIRTLSYLLHPPLLDDLGLVSALREYVQGFSDRSSIDAHLDILSSFTRLPPAVELALFRVAQESLANVQRHSGSGSARVCLSLQGPLITLEIIDFGRGMVLPPNGSPHSGQTRLGVGIPGMRERISQLGGRLDIVSGSAGTTVRATISLTDVPVADEVSDASPV